jgi:hypothetical protein
MQMPSTPNQLQEKPELLAGSWETSAPDLIYDLRAGNLSSGGFYADVARFSDKLLTEIDLRVGAAVRGYGDYVQTTLRESPRSFGEYSIELLTLGLALWRYGGAAESAPGWALDWARSLLWLRRQSAFLKPPADLVRAAITRQFLMKKFESGKRTLMFGNRVRAGVRQSTGPAETGPALLARLPRLIAWLEATGEFEQESIRLVNWLHFLNTLPEPESAHLVEAAMKLLEWFRREADIALGAYSRGVRGFLETEYRDRGCREDQIFCGKDTVEYHLNMVASEIMNRGLRADFERTAHKVVLVPGCMRGAFENSCRGQITGTDIECAGCNPQCTVNRITQRMRGLGARVFIVPHSTGFSRWLARWQREPDTGVTAAACLLNIVPGGYEMRARGISSQCVLLDYPGCRKHWREQGIATGINEERLARIVAKPF